DRKSTWDFKTNWRNWYFSSDQTVAWFEESLATQMEECRGSGVLIKENGFWKIAHYNLAVVIENEKMQKFIKLRRK
ncbi:MAG: nuclear transport factor 2 family protein, partial [Crocinitomix sp.]|nr:nuclear transport factor 2 family protein [Crocinitomix sp.]